MCIHMLLDFKVDLELSLPAIQDSTVVKEPKRKSVALDSQSVQYLLSTSYPTANVITTALQTDAVVDATEYNYLL